MKFLKHVFRLTRFEFSITSKRALGLLATSVFLALLAILSEAFRPEIAKLFGSTSAMMQAPASAATALSNLSGFLSFFTLAVIFAGMGSLCDQREYLVSAKLRAGSGPILAAKWIVLAVHCAISVLLAILVSNLLAFLLIGPPETLALDASLYLCAYYAFVSAIIVSASTIFASTSSSAAASFFLVTAFNGLAALQPKGPWPSRISSAATDALLGKDPLLSSTPFFVTLALGFTLLFLSARKYRSL